MGININNTIVIFEIVCLWILYFAGKKLLWEFGVVSSFRDSPSPACLPISLSLSLFFLPSVTPEKKPNLSSTLALDYPESVFRQRKAARLVQFQCFSLHTLHVWRSVRRKCANNGALTPGVTCTHVSGAGRCRKVNLNRVYSETKQGAREEHIHWRLTTSDLIPFVQNF